jgi:hypothetical protein
MAVPKANQHRSVPDIISHLFTQATTPMRKEVKLARAELART